MKIWQEFYCNDCDGYIRIKLNVEINRSVTICCPNPKCARHKDGHPRQIKNGEIVGDAYEKNAEEIMPPISAYSKESIVVPKHARAATKLTPEQLPKEEGPPKELVSSGRSPEADAIIRESWFERFGYYPARREE